ncbi:MAG: argininosuccinate lyase, partial [Thermomicrobia bacterium]|nr:argininosuccinate lyase [Thermomicrobia bacterium]MCA1724089.1 argininosuccinate lyase [Thermomicrobia bacterium]
AALLITEAIVRRALDPAAVVAARTLPGGPAPGRMRATIAESHARLDIDCAWLSGVHQQLVEAATARERVAKTLAAS